jgi:putative drug exporter of the RND superfamily
VIVRFPDTGDVRDHQAGLAHVLRVARGDGITATSFGDVSLDQEIGEITDEDLEKGESIGIVVALVVLVLVFGALVASALPIVVSVVAIVIATGLTALVGQLFDLSVLVTSMVTMMGLAVGIDYSLFVVSRYREERAAGHAKADAIARAGATASRAVLFSGLTVVLALAGMFVVPHTIFRSMALGASLVVLTAVLAALTLLPAMLALLGDRIEKGRVHRRSLEQHPFWDRVARAVMHRPVRGLVVGTGVLVLLASPALGLHTGFSGIDALPEATRARTAFEVLTTDFAGVLSDPVQVVVDGDVESPPVRNAIDELEQRVERDSTLGPATTTIDAGRRVAVVSAPVDGNPTGNAALDAVRRIRDDYVPASFDRATARVLVGGEPAETLDEVNTTNRSTPIAVVVVLALSFLLLMVMFRSIVVPLKAIVLNLLSVAAAYGVVVLVCQEGVGAELFGFRDVDAIEAWLPLFLFSVLFGLSMDYHVFLLSRIRERFESTRDNTEAVTHGIRTTGRLITGAALIMVAVFGGFASGRLADLQQVGLGLSVAVLVDATIVRAVLVPASMRLLGRWNWYLPRRLSWLPQVTAEAEVTPSTADISKDELVGAGV